MLAAAAAVSVVGVALQVGLMLAERRFFETSRRTPTANADGPCRSEGAARRASPETLPSRPYGSELAPRRAPRSW